MTRSRILILVLLFCATVFAFGQETNTASTDGPRLGFIFNAPSVLLDIESYQSGIGAILALDQIAFRVLADLYYADSANSFSGTTGAAFEYHLANARVSPYVGAFFDVGYTSQTVVTDEENSTKNTSMPISGGLIGGAELKLTRFLSLFAEYQIAITITRTNTVSTVAGVATEAPQTAFVLDTGIGNDSKIGIIVYLK